MKMKTKVCSKCGDTKPVAGYHKDRGAKDGHYSQCKKCALEAKRVDYIKHCDERKAKAKAYHEKNRDACLQRQSEYYRANRSERISKSIKHERENPEARNAKKRRYNRSLPDSYMIENLKHCGFRKEDITPCLINTKRALIKLKRAIKETV